MSGNIISIEAPRKKIVLTLLFSAIFLIISVLLWLQKDIDNSIVIWHNIIYQNETWLQFFQFVSRYGMGAISLMYSLLIFMSFRNKDLDHLRNYFLYILIAFAVSSIAGDLLKELIGRARPAVALAGKITLTEPSGTTSFPSGHATKSMGLALPFMIMALNKDTITKLFKITAFLLAVLVGYSRIALQKHFLSDVLAGVGIVLFFAVVAVWAANRSYNKRNMDEQKLSELNKKFIVIFAGLAAVLCMV